MQDRIRKIYLESFGEPALMVKSPGRINLIGEHTDYNQGFVLPAAINKSICLAIGKRKDDIIHLVAADLGENFTGTISNFRDSDLHWPKYLLGIFDQLHQNGMLVSGCNIVFGGDIPSGAGLSSSAAIECATIFALNELFLLGLTKTTMISLARKAENEFVGVQCGIMDQFASMMGKKDHVICLDCRSLEYDLKPFNHPEIEMVLFDTGIKHSLASSEYNLRRQECVEGVSIIQKKYPEVESLRDATLDMINKCLLTADNKVFMRCKYVVEENERLLEGCNDLEKNDLLSFGKKMFATHDGLSQLYEVSCPEADELVKMVRNSEAVLGARMMGGGFGGCTLNLVNKGMSEALVQTVIKKYASLFDRELKCHTVNIDNGTSLL